MMPIGLGSPLKPSGKLRDLLLLPEGRGVSRVIRLEHRALALRKADRLDEAVAALASP